MEDNDALSESQNLIEEMADGLYAPCQCSSGLRFPLAYATLQIDMTLMSEEDRKRVYMAEHLLKEVGVRFDSGSGCGGRDWELDWSLRGAFLAVRRIPCANYREHKERCFMLHAYWATYERESDNFISSHAYCSVECRDKDIARRSEEGVKVIWLAESEIL